MRDTDTIQRGIIRHIYLIIDLSLSMLDKDLRPSRLELTLNYLQAFVNEFFDQNPISQMGIIGMRNGIAERISNLSGKTNMLMNVFILCLIQEIQRIISKLSKISVNSIQPENPPYKTDSKWHEQA